MSDRMLSDEILIGLIKKNGGPGGTTDYDQLNNRPQIGGVTLTGDMSASDLGLASESGLTNYITTEYKGADSDTISAGSDKAFTIDISKTGYTPIFYVTVTTGHSQVIPYYYELNGNNLTVAVHNFTSDSFAVAPVVLVMYKVN